MSDNVEWLAYQPYIQFYFQLICTFNTTFNEIKFYEKQWGRGKQELCMICFGCIPYVLQFNNYFYEVQ